MTSEDEPVAAAVDAFDPVASDDVDVAPAPPHVARRRRLAWLLLAAAAVVALVVGAAVPRGSSSPSARAAAIERQLKCPSCEDLSVADSTAPSAIAIKALVLRDVEQGQSDAQIEAYLKSVYGPGIMLTPPASGATGIVWVAPVAAFVIALVGLGVFFWRRRSVGPAEVAPEDEALVAQALRRRRQQQMVDVAVDVAVDGAVRPRGAVTRQELEDERDFLLQSLEDLGSASTGPAISTMTTTPACRRATRRAPPRSCGSSTCWTVPPPTMARVTRRALRWRTRRLGDAGGGDGWPSSGRRCCSPRWRCGRWRRRRATERREGRRPAVTGPRPPRRSPPIRPGRSRTSSRATTPTP